jgi:hypothetical protein
MGNRGTNTVYLCLGKGSIGTRRPKTVLAGPTGSLAIEKRGMKTRRLISPEQFIERTREGICQFGMAMRNAGKGTIAFSGDTRCPLWGRTW